MTCAEARLLLDQGIAAGSTGGRHRQLGFHLAGCAECRAYRERRDQDLLAALLSTPLAAVSHRYASMAVRRTHEQQTASPFGPNPHPVSERYPRYFALVAAGAALALLLWGGWYIGLPLYRAYWYIHSMQQPPNRVAGRVSNATQIGALTPLLMPTATSAPTATSEPSVTPTLATTPTAVPTATPAPTPTASLPPVRAVTVALLGVDARPGEGFAARSDALMLVRLDLQHDSATLLSMPRDLWVAIPGYGESKINAAFYFGERQAPGQGLALAQQTLGSAFKVQVDHAVVIDFQGFRSLINALDGITVDVPKEIYDGHFPTDDYGYTVAHFLPGPQKMDGAAALMYARTRHPDSDFERIKRQQLVLVGIAQRLKERGALQNLHEADQLTQALAPFVKTDMPVDLVLSLLWSIREIDPASVRRYTIEGSLLWETSVNGAYALVPREGALPTMGQKLLARPVP